MSGSRAEIGELWRAVNREMHDHFRQTFQGSEIHFGMLMMLKQIKQAPGVTVSELARRTGVVKSHVSKMVEQLVRQGYLEKRPDPTDQRLVRIDVTQAGAGALAETDARAQNAWADVVEQIPEGELDDVMRGLRILLTALTKSNGKESTDPKQTGDNDLC